MYNFIEQIYHKNKDYKGIVFLDRDGTINKEVNYLHDVSKLEILPHVGEGIRVFNEHNIAVIVITNQPVVARGLLTIKGLKEINDTLVERLKKEGASIDAIYSCPHHPEKDHDDIPTKAMKYRIVCDCRKPGLAMHKKAMAMYGLTRIVGVIGDHAKDILAAKNLRAPGVLVETDYKGSGTFLDAVRMLL